MTFPRFTRLTYIGLGMIAFALVLFLVVRYVNGAKRQVPLVFSQREVLENTWDAYKINTLEAGSGRTLDKSLNNLTTSEGQSYTMLRAVWMDDKETFDKSFAFAQSALKHKDDNLHAWQFGQISGDKYGILANNGGNNSATDAESDIAVALLFAYERWNDQEYLDQAKALIADIWKYEVVTVKGKQILAANDVERFSSSKIIVNPSYLSPYAYRMFAIVDPAHNWQAVIDSSYELIGQSMTMQLDKGSSAHIPPDWIQVNRQTGAIEAVPNAGLTTNYSYDALRTPWRLALDWQWYQESRAKQLLDQMSFFTEEWNANREVSVTYSHDGTIIGDQTEVPALYGGLIGYFMTSDTANAEDVYKEKLQILYSTDTNAWRTPLGYYDDNWAWFGIGLYLDLLPNLAKDLSLPAKQ
ncbi:MAG: glycosyl hydrolase family 8 [Patescibacteria group bacterium]